MATYKKQKKRGRNPLDEASVTVNEGFKCSKSLRCDIERAVDRLNAMGYRTNKSELIRKLVEANLDIADEIYEVVAEARLRKSS